MPPIDILCQHRRELDAKLRRQLRDARISAKAGTLGSIMFMEMFGERWLRDLEARNVVRQVLDRAMERRRNG